MTLIGDGGLLPGLIKLALERGLTAELTRSPGLPEGRPGGAGDAQRPQRQLTDDGAL